MKNGIKRGLAATILGATLAVGAAAIAAVPANAATQLPVDSSGSPASVALAGGTYFEGYVNYAWGAPQIQLDRVVLRVSLTNATNVAMLDPKACAWDASNQCTYTSSYGPVTAKKLSATSAELTVNIPSTASFYGVNVASPLFTNTASSATGTVTWDVISVTPRSTGVAENVVGEPQHTTVVTWSTLEDTPVVAPALAGIALLGAAGAGTGIALRRKKAKRA